MKQNKLGIVGGLGPETGCMFCLNINNKFKSRRDCQPDIVLENVPVPSEVEKNIISGKTPQEMLHLLITAVTRLNAAEVDFITIPCNTVHVFIDILRAVSAKPILSIIEECADECAKRRLKKVGILASTTSVRNRLHELELKKKGIDILHLEDDDQEEVSRIILRILNCDSSPEDKNKLLRIIDDLKTRGAEAVILGCTDLQLVISKEDSVLDIIDTTAVLEDAAVERLLAA